MRSWMSATRSGAMPGRGRGDSSDGAQPHHGLQDRRAVDRQEDLLQVAVALIAIAVEGGDDAVRDHGLPLQQGVVGRSGLALLAHLLRELGDLLHQRVALREDLERQLGVA